MTAYLRVAIVLVMLGSSGCSTLRVAMAGPFIGGDGFSGYERVGRRVEGASCLFNLLGSIPLGAISFSGAYDEAMLKAPAEATGLSSATFWTSSDYAVIGRVECARVAGIPAVRTIDLPASDIPPAPPTAPSRRVAPPGAKFKKKIGGKNR